jgi:hypothetical protein
MSLTISPPPPRVRFDDRVERSFAMNCDDRHAVDGAVAERTGTMSSPWPPSTIARTSLMLTPPRREEELEARRVEHAGHARRPSSGRSPVTGAGS